VPRIALIHALAHSSAPITEALARDWPAALRMNLLDDSLAADLERSGVIDEAMTRRFLALAGYAIGTGADAILFTCSAFAPCIDEVKRHHPATPVLEPYEAMIDEAAASGVRIGLIASFAPTLASMPSQFPPGTPLDLELADVALAALNAGDAPAHDRAVADAAARLAARGAGVIALAQFSMARAASAVASRTGLPVLTTVDSAVRRLRSLLSP
jgi:Asp/Glu/hydantoin racemase